MSGQPNRFIAPATAGVVLLLEALVGLAELKRPLFFAISAVAVVLTLGLAIWYGRLRDIGKALTFGGGCVLVLLLAWAGAPSSTQASLSGPPPSGNAPSVVPSFDSGADEVVVEEPSEADAIFNRALGETTPWYNEVGELFASATVEDAEGEAAISGAWWALADWCVHDGNGNEGRCYDLAALYIRERFERDPRTINSETWYGAGAVGAAAAEGYDRTAKYLDIEPSGLLPELVEDRPGIEWECEPSCTAGAPS